MFPQAWYFVGGLLLLAVAAAIWIAITPVDYISHTGR